MQRVTVTDTYRLATIVYFRKYAFILDKKLNDSSILSDLLFFSVSRNKNNVGRK